jgi:hypothetical protein
MKYNANSFLATTVHCIGLFLLFSPSVFSQQSLLTVEEERFELTPKLSGKANYSYYLDKSKRIYHGPFYFNSSKTDSIKANIVIGREFSGHYKDGLKNDNWTFSQMQLQDDGYGMAIREPKYTIVHNSSGVDFLVQAKFDAGQAKGKWSAGNFEIFKGEVVDTLFFTEANFVNNQYVGSFNSGSARFEISGILDENGFFNGIWTIQHKHERIIEKRQFEQGVLVKHLISLDGREQSLNHIGFNTSIDSEDEEWDTLYLNDDYLNILLYINVTEGNNAAALSKIVRKSNDFLMNSLTSFDGFENSIWKITDGSEGIYLPKVKVRKFPFKNDEKAQIINANDKLYACESILNNYLIDPQVNISKYSIENVALYFSAYKIYHDELIKLRRLLDILSSTSAEYLNKTEFIPFVFSGTSFPTSVNYNFNDENRSKELAFPSSLSNEDATIENIVKHITEIESYLIKKQKIIKPVIEESKKRAEIADKEELLVSKKDSIIQLFGNSYGLTNFNSYHERYADKAINYIENEFKQYAKQTVELRIDRIEIQLECFQKFIEFYSFLANLPTRFEEVELLYTRTVWNPFTFTDMDEIVKERVFNSYNKIIIPNLLNELEESMSCDKIAERMMNFKILFKRMNTLRNQDTQNLESRLKRLTDTRDVLREFELNLVVE